jgi:hypothetical protein
MFQVEDPQDEVPSSHTVGSFAEITHPDVVQIHARNRIAARFWALIETQST